MTIAATTKHNAQRRRFFITAPVALAGAVALPTQAANTCFVSDGDILGPFYRSGASSTTKLTTSTTQGQQIVITGIVLRPDCKTPVVGATIDFWHADHSGAYDVKTPDEKIAPENFKFRSVAQTDKDGKFIIETIVPGL